MPVVINGTTGISGVDGSAGTPSYQGGDTNTGIFYPAADTIAFAEGGTEVMRIDTSGNVLVNTTNTGADGLNISVIKNISFAEGSGVSYANMFRQSSSAALVLAMGYKHTLTPNGFASSVGTSIAKSAISLVAGGITFYADSATTVANGTDATPTERMRIDSSGNVGIGNSIPSTFNAFANNLVIGNGSSDEGLTIYTGTTNVGTLNFADGTSGSALYQGYIQYVHSLDEMRFFVNYAGSSSFRMSINSNGGVQASNSISVGNATPTTSGAGITFPATQSASSSANTLDDYEEGTWTPTIATGLTSPTYSNQSGNYTKIGNVVTFTFRIAVSSSTRNGTILSFSLPFTGINNGYLTGSAAWGYVNSSVIGSNTTNLPTLYLSSNEARIYCYKTTPDAFYGTDLAGDVPDIYVGGTYLTTN